MNAQYQDNRTIIARAFNAEARAYTKSGLAWLAFSPIAQYLLFVWFRKTQIMQPSTVEEGWPLRQRDRGSDGCKPSVA
ncbi:MAG TPA: hypothetical protein VF553_21985 [Pyrinomonadaceae bacterium]|jgi:hypothetical protein